MFQGTAGCFAASSDARRRLALLQRPISLQKCTGCEENRVEFELPLGVAFPTATECNLVSRQSWDLQFHTGTGTLAPPFMFHVCSSWLKIYTMLYQYHSIYILTRICAGGRTSASGVSYEKIAEHNTLAIHPFGIARGGRRINIPPGRTPSGVIYSTKPLK